MRAWAVDVAAVVFALAMTLILVHRLWRQLSKQTFVAATVFLATALIVGFVFWLLRGFSVTSFFALVGIGYFALLVATWGRPGQMFEIGLKESSLSARQARWFQIRLIVVALAIFAASMPLLLALI